MRGFSRRVTKDIESYGHEDGISDELMELVCTSYSNHDNSTISYDDEMSYVTFFVDRQRYCSLRVMRRHNQVGMKVWEAGLFLADLCLSTDLLSKKVVVELGAGVGCTTIPALIALPKADKPRKLYVTEGPLDVVENLRFNVAINSADKTDNGCDSDNTIDTMNKQKDTASGNHSVKDQAYSFDDCEVHVDALDWLNCSEQSCRDMDADIVLAADCTYSEDISEALIETYIKLLAKPTSIGLIACTVRNPTTFQHFMTCLSQKLHLRYTDVTKWANDCIQEQKFHYDNRSAIRVLRLQRIQ
jgi:predicted nicotinamide N-methyase